MAKTITNLAFGVAGSGTTFATTDFIPVVGDTILIASGIRFTSNPATPVVTVVDSTLGVNGFTTGTISLQVSQGGPNANPFKELSVWSCVVATVFGTGSGHFLLTSSDNTASFIVRGTKVTGTGAITIVSAGSNNSSAGSTNPNVTMGALGNAANAYIAFELHGSDSVTVSAADLSPTGNTVSVGSQAMRMYTCTADPAVDNTPNCTLSSSFPWALGVIEINEATGTIVTPAGFSHAGGLGTGFGQRRRLG